MSTNKLLARMTRADFALLAPHLEPVELPVRTQLHAANRRIERVYFLENGVASIVANGDRPIEVGIIGREGMTGAWLVLGNDGRTPYQVYMQIAGNGLQLPVARLCEAMARSPTLHQALLCCASCTLS